MGKPINVLRRKAIESGFKIYTDNRQCKKCGSNIFYTSGFSCVNCSIARGVEKYAKNKEEISVARKIKGKTPKDKEYNKKWREENKEHIYLEKKKWKKNNPEKVRAYSKSHEAKRRGAVGRFTDKDIKRILKQQKNKCAECRTCIKGGYDVDHIMPIALGGTSWPKNLQCLCKKCNNKKSAKHPIVWAQENGKLL